MIAPKKKVLLGILAFFLVFSRTCLANDVVSQENILQEQMEELRINDFLEEGKKYSQDVLEDMDLTQVLTEALTRENRASNHLERNCEDFWRRNL